MLLIHLKICLPIFHQTIALSLFLTTILVGEELIVYNVNWVANKVILCLLANIGLTRTLFHILINHNTLLYPKKTMHNDNNIHLYHLILFNLHINHHFTHNLLYQIDHQGIYKHFIQYLDKLNLNHTIHPLYLSTFQLIMPTSYTFHCTLFLTLESSSILSLYNYLESCMAF